MVNVSNLFSVKESILLATLPDIFDTMHLGQKKGSIL